MVRGMRRLQSECRHPGRMLTELVKTHPLMASDVLLVLVRDPARTQRIEHVTRLERQDWATIDQDDMSDVIYREVNAMPIPAWDKKGPKHTLVTIVARHGFTVLGPRETKWLIAWRYSNHLTNAYSGSLMIVTEHGWTDFMSGTGGATPRLEKPLRLVGA